VLPIGVTVAEMLNKLNGAMKPAPSKRAQIEFLASERPAEMARLLADEEYFRAAARGVETAKNFLITDTYGRLTTVAAIKTRAEALTLTQNLARLITLTITKTGEAKWATNLGLTATVMDHLNQNGNVRAQLTYLATSWM
jgi:hypothetical protein